MLCNKISLLDILAGEAQCLYLSDLRLLYTESEMREKLTDIIMEIPIKIASLTEWNDALAYLTGVSGAINEEQAKSTLIDCLRT